MKKTLLKLVETKKENKRNCIIAALLATALLLSLAAGCRDNKPHDAPSESGTTTTTTTAATVGETTTTAPSAEEVALSTTAETKATTAEKVVKTTESKKPSTTTTTTTATTAKKVAQAADPDTGISWDGKSPIVYTYEDGSTGTEAEPGARYEYKPGVFYAVPPDLSDAPENTGYCPHCGKEEGDGADGTCLRYIGNSGHNCGHCGVFVAAKTCHTCGN